MDRPSIESAKLLLIQAWTLYRTHFRQLLATIALILLPIALLSLGIQAWTQQSGTNLSGLIQLAMQGLLTHLLVILPISVLGGLLAQAAVLFQLNAVISGHELPDWRRAWAATLPRLRALVLSSLLVVLGTILGLCLFIVPGVWFLHRCLLVTQVVVMEGRSGLSAIQRSSSLVTSAKNEAWLLMGAMFALTALSQLAASLLMPEFFASFCSDLLRIALLPTPLIGLTLFYKQLVGPAASEPAPGPAYNCES
jgi:hypothetical protein